MKIDYVTIGKRISLRRKEISLTQKELAELVGVGDKHISALETGRSVPSLDVFIKIAKVLDSSLDYIVWGISPIKNPMENNKIAIDIEMLANKDKNLVLQTIDYLKKHRWD